LHNQWEDQMKFPADADRPRMSRSGQALADLAYSEIKSRILANTFPQGFHAFEEDLAQQFGMSRTPMREALLRLRSEGLVEIIPRRGVRVVPQSAADMRHIYEVLTALEATAVELAAKRRPRAAELAPMRDALDDMDAALGKDDRQRWAEADERFHRALLDVCGNPRLRAMALSLWDHAYRAKRITLDRRPKPTDSNTEHRAVYEAIKRGDGKQGRKVHYAQRMRSCDILTALLESNTVPDNRHGSSMRRGFESADRQSRHPRARQT
jgi:DNA-binding GntR family transcriptional regulator